MRTEVRICVLGGRKHTTRGVQVVETAAKIVSAALKPRWVTAPIECVRAFHEKQGWPPPQPEAATLGFVPRSWLHWWNSPEQIAARKAAADAEHRR